MHAKTTRPLRKVEGRGQNETRLICSTFADWMSPAKSNKIQVVWEFIQWTLLSFLCTIARQSKCRTNKNQSLSIDMHWMFSQCSDRDASPNSGLKITRRPSCVCWSGGAAAKDGRSSYLYKTWQVVFLPSLYHRRQCGSTERKIATEREGGERKGEKCWLMC